MNILRLLATLYVAVISVTIAAEVAVPHILQNGTVADAVQINENFETLANSVNSIVGQSCANGSVVTGLTSNGDILCTQLTVLTTQVGSSLSGAAGASYALVALDQAGDTLVVGAQGLPEISVFDRVGAEWQQRGSSLPAPSTLTSISISGSGNVVAFADSTNSSNRGRAWVYEWSNDSWQQRGSAFSGDFSFDFLNSPDLNFDGTVLALGEFQYLNNNGRVRVWDWNGASWIQRTEIVGTTGFRIGEDPKISSDGATLATGSLRINSDEGAAYVYQWNGAAWTQKGETISLGLNNSTVRVALSSDANTMAIKGLDAATGGVNDFSIVRVYRWDGASWSQVGADIIGDQASGGVGRPGVAISSDGTTVVSGDFVYADASGNQVGQVRVFRRIDNDDWRSVFTVLGQFDGDALGFSVSVDGSGRIVSFSAKNASNNGVAGSGLVQTFSVN